MSSTYVARVQFTPSPAQVAAARRSRNRSAIARSGRRIGRADRRRRALAADADRLGIPEVAARARSLEVPRLPEITPTGTLDAEAGTAATTAGTFEAAVRDISRAVRAERRRQTVDAIAEQRREAQDEAQRRRALQTTVGDHRLDGSEDNPAVSASHTGAPTPTHGSEPAPHAPQRRAAGPRESHDPVEPSAPTTARRVAGPLPTPPDDPQTRAPTPRPDAVVHTQEILDRYDGPEALDDTAIIEQAAQARTDLEREAVFHLARRAVDTARARDRTEADRHRNRHRYRGFLELLDGSTSPEADALRRKLGRLADKAAAVDPTLPDRVERVRADSAALHTIDLVRRRFTGDGFDVSDVAVVPLAAGTLREVFVRRTAGPGPTPEGHAFRIAVGNDGGLFITTVAGPGVPAAMRSSLVDAERDLCDTLDRFVAEAADEGVLVEESRRTPPGAKPPSTMDHPWATPAHPSPATSTAHAQRPPAAQRPRTRTRPPTRTRRSS